MSHTDRDTDRDTGIVLVTGATGNQGGATARALLAMGRTVHALVRDPARPAARALQDQGAVLVQGDLDDHDSLRRALTGVHGVFSVQPLALSEEELATEVARGKAVADLAHEAGVAHLVYSSVGGAERGSGIGHFESKAEVERHVLALGVPATILRPVFFMDNLLHFATAKPEPDGERLLRLPVKPGLPMQFIASEDIGHIAAHAFAHPETSLGTQVEIAGDAVTFDRVAELLTEVTGTPTRLAPEPITERMFAWFVEEGYRADLPALRRAHPGLLTVEEFLRARVG